MNIEQFLIALAELDVPFVVCDGSIRAKETGYCPILTLHQHRFPGRPPGFFGTLAAEELGLSRVDAQAIMDGADDAVPVLRPQLLAACHVRDEHLRQTGG